MDHSQDRSLTQQAVSATLHCLTGCAIGEITGLIISSALGWGPAASIALAIALAFLFGYSLTIWSIRAARLSMRQKISLAATADTLSIATMEIVDNLIILLIPGALVAGLSSGLFWGSLLLSLVVAFWVTVPVNRYLLQRGKGHAAIHQFHH